MKVMLDLKIIMDDYNEITCITAGELRKQGIILPDNIPDCGYVPKDSISISLGKQPEITDNLIHSRIMEINMEYRFLKPFKWLEIPIIVNKGDSNV